VHLFDIELVFAVLHGQTHPARHLAYVLLKLVQLLLYLIEAH